MIYPDIPEKALSIMQPWAFLITSGLKAIENRDRRTNFRGEIAIHAGKQFDRDARQDLIDNRHPVTGAGGMFIAGMPKDFFVMAQGELCGGIVGVAEIVDCIEHSNDEWFVGRYGYVLRNARPVPFISCSGALGFFDWRKRLESATGAAA